MMCYLQRCVLGLKLSQTLNSRCKTLLFENRSDKDLNSLKRITSMQTKSEMTSYANDLKKTPATANDVLALTLAGPI